MWAIWRGSSTESARRSQLVDRRHSSLLVSRESLLVALGVSANQFRRPIGIRRRLASRGPHTGSSTVTSVGVTVLTAVGAVAGCGGEVQSSQCFIKDYLCVVVPVPSVRLCVCLCVVRSDRKHNNNKRDVVYSSFPGADLAISSRFIMASRTTIYVRGETTSAVDLR